MELGPVVWANELRLGLAFVASYSRCLLHFFWGMGLWRYCPQILSWWTNKQEDASLRMVCGLCVLEYSGGWPIGWLSQCWYGMNLESVSSPPVPFSLVIFLLSGACHLGMAEWKEHRVLSWGFCLKVIWIMMFSLPRRPEVRALEYCVPSESWLGPPLLSICYVQGVQ